MKSMTSPRAVLAGCLLALAVAGCSAIGDAIPKGGPIAQSLAEDYARLASGISVAPVAVVSSRLSTYGAERPGGTAAGPGDQVWAVILSGMFPVASCFVQVPVFNLNATPPPANPCPAPSARERVLVDANSGKVLEVIPGG